MALRCSHGMLAGLCQVPSCTHADPGLAAGKSKATGRHLSDDEIVAGLRGARSLMAAAAALGCTTNTIYHRAKASAVVREAVNATRAPKSWGARQRHPAFIDLTGQTIGTWTVLKRAKNSWHGNACWLCRHSCGGVQILEGIRLRSGPPLHCDDCRPARPGTVQRVHG